MDVDKKLGMSLDDLIKKTRKDRPQKPQQSAKKFEKKGQLGVKKALGKKREDTRAVRATGKTGAVAAPRRVRRVSAAPVANKNQVRRPKSDQHKSRRANNEMDTSDRSFARKVVVRKGPAAPVENRRKIKITNVPYDLTWKDVKGALSSVGTIERCDVERGEATLQFATHKEAARAIQTYNDGDMNGRKIKVFFI